MNTHQHDHSLDPIPAGAMLTRAEAIELVDAAAQLGALRHLATHWDYFDLDSVSDAELHECLLAFVDCACDCDAARSRGPRDSDQTNLTACDLI